MFPIPWRNPEWWRIRPWNALEHLPPSIDDLKTIYFGTFDKDIFLFSDFIGFILPIGIIGSTFRDKYVNKANKINFIIVKTFATCCRG